MRSSERQFLVQTKQKLMQCLLAEIKLANFLFECTEKHSLELSLEETLTTRELVNRVHDLIAEIRPSDENSHDNDPTTRYQNLHAGSVKSTVEAPSPKGCKKSVDSLSDSTSARIS